MRATAEPTTAIAKQDRCGDLPHRPRVLLGAAIVVAHLELVDLERRGVHPARRHRDHSAGASCAQLLEQQRGQKERSDHLARHGRLEAVGCLLPMGRQGACVVHEDVDHRIPTLQLGRKLGDEVAR